MNNDSVQILVTHHAVKYQEIPLPNDKVLRMFLIGTNERPASQEDIDAFGKTLEELIGGEFCVITGND